MLFRSIAGDGAAISEEKLLTLIGLAPESEFLLFDMVTEGHGV